jgi:alpha-methylacyl-CoA racemase
MGVLNGVKVLELAAIGPVPFCGMLLADMGADVIRVDRIEPADLGVPIPTRFDVLNRGKRSVAVDLKQPAGAMAVRQLAARADVLLEGFRPGVTEKLGLGPIELLAANPRLVYGRMTGWGQAGPLAQKAGHDLNYIALSGVLHCIGRAGGVPTPPLNLVGDFGGGALYLAVGVLGALLHARQSGQGQVVDAAMVDGAASLMAIFHCFRQMGEWSDTRGSNVLDSGAPYYDVYETSDGKWVSIGAIESRFYRQLLAVLELPETEAALQNQRSEWPRMRDIFRARFRTKSRDAWVEAFASADACFAPVLDLGEAVSHPHASARDAFVVANGVVQPAPAPRFTVTPSSVRGVPPAAGQHSESVLADWGFSTDDITALRREHVILQTKGVS